MEGTLPQGKHPSRLELFDLAVVDLRAALQHAISKVDGANMAEVEKLRVELEEGERRAVEAKSVPKDYYQVFGEQYSVLVRQSVGLVPLHQVWPQHALAMKFGEHIGPIHYVIIPIG